MFGDFEQWLSDLQSSPVERKRKWLIGLSATAMILVVAVWLTYFRAVVALPMGETTTQTSDATISPSFWGTMAEGLKTISQGFKSGAVNLGNVLQSPRSYIIKPPVN